MSSGVVCTHHLRDRISVVLIVSLVVTSHHPTRGPGLQERAAARRTHIDCRRAYGVLDRLSRLQRVLKSGTVVFAFDQCRINQSIPHHPQYPALPPPAQSGGTTQSPRPLVQREPPLVSLSQTTLSRHGTKTSSLIRKEMIPSAQWEKKSSLHRQASLPTRYNRGANGSHTTYI